MVAESVEDTKHTTKLEESPPLTLEILKVIKNAQQQHGLRHGDYQRYRGYCSRRIRRLRKVMKLAQGDRRHFKRRDVTETHLIDKRSDERYLQIPLMCAERCWAYAMQLRQESNTEPRKKFHLIHKLRKACIYAIQLEELTRHDRCDARTKLEAQAYVAWLQGNLQFELEIWLRATENLKNAQIIYEKLASTLPEDEQLPYKQRTNEIQPSLRYCAYNIGDEKAVDLLELRSKGILENFDALVTQQQQKTEAVLHEVDWFNNLKIPITIERIRLFLLSIEGLDDSLKHAENQQAKIKILENLFIDLRDVISLAREKQDQLLLTYLLSIRVERTSQRHLLLIQQTRKPQDCVRLLDIIVQQTLELSQNDSIKGIAQIQDYYNEQLQAYRALRLYYLARNQSVQKHWKEAAILFDSASKSLLKINQNHAKFINELQELLQAAKDAVDVEKINAQANYVLELQDEIQLVPQKVHKSKKPLIERLEEFRDEPQLLTKNPNVVNLPPNMEPIPTKPLFYDLALNFVELPDLQEKLDGGKTKQGAAGISGFVKGLWGWGKK